MAGGEVGPRGIGAAGDAASELFEDLLTVDEQAAMPQPRRSWLDRILWLLSLVPVAALGLFVSMAVRVRLTDGVWPMRDQPDPKNLGFHNTVTVAAILASFVVVVLVPIIALAGFFLGRRRVAFLPPLVAVAGFAVLFATLAADVGGLGEWIGD
jgi:hypothetical protein